MSHQEIWFGGSHKKGQDLVFESVGCVLYSLLVAGHGRGRVVTWEEVVQYHVPMERKPEGPECVFSISRMLSWDVQNNLMEKTFLLWDTKMLRVCCNLGSCWRGGRALLGTLCCVGNMEKAVPSLGFVQDSSSPAPFGEGWPRPISALVIPEPALAKLVRALAYLGRSTWQVCTLLNCRHFFWVANLGGLLSLIKEGFSLKAPYLVTLGIYVMWTLTVLSTQGVYGVSPSQLSLLPDLHQSRGSRGVLPTL